MSSSVGITKKRKTRSRRPRNLQRRLGPRALFLGEVFGVSLTSLAAARTRAARAWQRRTRTMARRATKVKEAAEAQRNRQSKPLQLVRGTFSKRTIFKHII